MNDNNLIFGVIACGIFVLLCINIILSKEKQLEYKKQNDSNNNFNKKYYSDMNVQKCVRCNRINETYHKLTNNICERCWDNYLLN